MFWVGILLIVSAGSFIYVATIHILPEVFGTAAHAGPSSSQEEASELDTEENATEFTKNALPLKEKEHFSKGVELLFMMAGLVSPFVLMLVKDE